MENEFLNENNVTYSTCDVFHDLGLADADELLMKSNLAIAIHDTLAERGLTPAEAAELLGLDPQALSTVVSGRLSQIPTERLLYYLFRLGLNVDILIHKDLPTTGNEGSINIAYV